MADVSFRLAVEADYPAVLEISQGVYEGNDYFISEFFNFLNDPNRRILIAEKNCKAVGLQVLHIVDEGETAIAQALRVHIEYRRQGIGKRLIHECRDYVKEHFPEVKYERSTVTSNTIESVEMRKKSDDVLFHKIAYFACYVNGNAFELASCLERCGIVRYNDVKPLSEIEFGNVLQQQNVENILFKNLCFVNWGLFKPLLSNVRNGLTKAGDSFFASFSGESVESLSHAQWCPIVKCPQLVTACYTLDGELLKTHAVKQLEDAIKRHPGETFIFCLLMDTSLVGCASELLFTDLSLTNLLREEKHCHVFLFEKSLV